MKSASVIEIKTELGNLNNKELLELSLRLIKYKKDNKEFINYLLFEASDVSSYTEKIKLEMDEAFESINKSNLYFAKKSLRKILRLANKYIKYISSKEAEVELLIYFCERLQASEIAIKKSAALKNLYVGQVKKINQALVTLHPDLQFDYTKRVELIERIP